MYLWKYWRETRIVLGVSLLCISILFVLILREHTVLDPHAHFDRLSGILPIAFALQIFPVSFVAWLFGSFGVGRDLGERSGSYLFTRPRSRAFFVWRDWGLGIVQLLLIVASLNMIIGLQIQRIVVAAGDPLHGGIVIAGRPVTLASIVCLNVAAAFLLAGLVFSLTYFSTILVKSAKGLMLGAGVLLGYLILGGVVAHYWPGTHLPDLILQEFTQSGRRVTGIPDRLGLSMAIRAGIILLFPFAAQFVLQKTDISD